MTRGETLSDRITSYVAGHDANIRAAVRLVCGSVLLRKIGGYVDADGWVEWERLAGDLIAGLPWSSGEKRVARLACSLSGQIAYLGDTDRVTDVLPWTLADLLYGLDEQNVTAALDAVHYAATGRPPAPTNSGGAR